MLIGVVLAHQLLTEQVVVLYPDATMTQLHIAYESSRRESYKRFMSLSTDSMRSEIKEKPFNAFLGALFVEGGRTAVLSYFVANYKFPAKVPTWGSYSGILAGSSENWWICKSMSATRRHPRRLLRKRMEGAAEALSVQLSTVALASNILLRLDDLQIQLGYRFNNPKLLCLAFVHVGSLQLPRERF